MTTTFKSGALALILSAAIIAPAAAADTDQLARQSGAGAAAIASIDMLAALKFNQDAGRDGVEARLHVGAWRRLDHPEPGARLAGEDHPARPFSEPGFPVRPPAAGPFSRVLLPRLERGSRCPGSSSTHTSPPPAG
jgi:hypothetical protein